MPSFNKTSTKTPKLQQKYKKIAKLEGTPSPSIELQKQQQRSLKCSKNTTSWQRGRKMAKTPNKWIQ